MDRVKAQQARRILDRLVGYELSPFLWKKVARGLSAGRVQSVTVRLIVEREREIQQFDAKEYWTIDAIFNKKNLESSRHSELVSESSHSKKTILKQVQDDDIDEKNLPQGYFVAKLHSINNESLDKFEIADEKHAKQLMTVLKDADYSISRIEKKETKKNPYAPFTTSTLQQEANRKLGFSSKQTMRIAQQLYEQGHITYMRTDSVNLSTKFIDDAKEYISKTLGKEYVLDAPRLFKTKSKTAQEAHEAIRPTEANQIPEILNGSLDKNQHKLYDLVWRRAVASQMPEAIMDNTSIDVSAKTDAEYTFRTTGQTIKFDGFLKVYSSVQKEDILPELKEGEKVDSAQINPNQHFTEPPARYSDASLVKALEEFEIGRPSTYAPTISTVIDRGYVDRIENRRLKPTDIAFLVTDILVEHFKNVTDYKFTARMEDELDEIAEGKLDWEKAISEFYEPFKKNLMEKTETLDKKDLTEEKTDEKCDKCGNPMIIKTGRFGRFLACTAYPECKSTKPLGEDGEPEEVEITNEKCEKCGAPMQFKHGRFGKFLGCTKYPECKGIKNIEKGTGVTCPECGKGEIIEKKSKKGRTFYACNQYPKCKTAFFAKPVGQTCPECKSQLVYGPKDTYKCSSKECKFTKDAE